MPNSLDDLILGEVDWKSELKVPPTAGDIKSPEEYADDAYEYLLTTTEKKGGRLPWDFDWRFQPSHLNLFMGINGHGKSLVLSQMMAWLTQDDQSDRREVVLIWSPEMTPAAQVARLVQQMTGIAKPSRAYFNNVVEWLGGRVYVYQRTHKVTTDEIRGVSLFAQRRLGVTQIVIDSLVKIHIPNQRDYLLAQTALADDLACLARDSGLCINLVCHARKGDKESDRLTKFDLKGAGSIADLADAILIVSRNVRKHEEQKRAKGEPTDFDDQPDGYIEMVKNRHRSELPLLPLWFNADSNQFTRQEGKRMCMRSLRDFSNAQEVM